MASTKDLKALVRTAERAGWTVSRTRNDHYRWIHPQGGKPYFSSSTPSDSRAIRNIRHDLVKRGLKVV